VAAKRIFTLNYISRVVFLLLTPVFFQLFAIGFIWHSIYWGVITAVMLIWGAFILLAPLFGRIGCGWFCFMGTVNDLAGARSLIRRPWNKPKIWVRSLILLPFFASAFLFYYMNSSKGLTHGFAPDPMFLKPSFNMHYKVVWMADVLSAFILGLFLERRWLCRNLCFMGALCSAGAKHSRLVPVVDKSKCVLCGKCEEECPVRIPITGYIKDNKGLVTNGECLMCGRCAAVCRTDAIRFRFVWNRKRFKEQVADNA